MEIDDVRRAFDELLRDRMRDALGHRAVRFAGKHAVQIFVVGR
jgi:hypothetical protein